MRIILLSLSINGSVSLSPYFVPENGKEDPFICSRNNWGMRHCQDVPPSLQDGKTCSAAPNHELSANACVNWNMYYNVCRPGDHNPHKGSISFDHTALAMIAMFQVREQWSSFLLSSVHQCFIIIGKSGFPVDGEAVITPQRSSVDVLCSCRLSHWRAGLTSCSL